MSGRMIKDRWPQLTDLDRRLADMDAQGVDVQLVSPSPSHFYYFAGEELALQLAKPPTRRCGTSWTAPRTGSTAWAWFRCSTLHLHGGSPGTRGPGHAGCWAWKSVPSPPPPATRTAPPLSCPTRGWNRSGARAEELGALVFLHPFGCSLDERLDRFYLANTVSQPAENAVALSHLIFSGVLDRHPDAQDPRRTRRRVPSHHHRPLRPRLDRSGPRHTGAPNRRRPT